MTITITIPKTLEYSGGFCEPVTDTGECLKKIQDACIEGPVTLHCGGILTRPEYSMVWFYERNWRNEKSFVACLMTKDIEFINAVIAKL